MYPLLRNTRTHIAHPRYVQVEWGSLEPCRARRLGIADARYLNSISARAVVGYSERANLADEKILTLLSSRTESTNWENGIRNRQRFEACVDNHRLMELTGKLSSETTTVCNTPHYHEDKNQPILMESDNTSLDVAKEALLNEGLWRLRDAQLCEDMAKMEVKGFPFWTEEGLDFCIQHVLGRTAIRSLIKSWFGQRCVLVHWIRYRAYPGHTICFRGGGPEAGRRRLMVHLFAAGSEVRYYIRSHLQKLPTHETEFLYYEVPQPAVIEAGFETKTVDNGEVALFDARLKIELKKGYVIGLLFATEDVVAKWPPMRLPYSPGLAKKVRDEMESDEIGVNFEIDEPRTSAYPKPAR